MNIFVFIKQVPDTATRIKIAADGKNIDESDLTWAISPYDEFALEEALRIKESKGAGKGDRDQPRTGSRRHLAAPGLAMGADDAIHVWDPALAGGDAFATAKVLAASVKNRSFDILYFGKMGAGMDQYQVPSMVAELLNLPQVTQVASMEIGDRKITAHREIEGATEIVEASIPVVIAAEKGKNEPRYPNLKGIMAAKKKPLETVTLATLGLRVEEVGEKVSKTTVNSLSMPASRQAGKMLQGDTADVVKQLVDLLHNEAKVI